MFKPVYLYDEFEEADNPTLPQHDNEEQRTETEVLGVAAVVLATLVTFFGWQYLKALLDRLEREWDWYALEFDMPLDIPGFMDLALIGFAACMLAVGLPYFARLMRRPWGGWGDAAHGAYWLGSAVCAWCFMSASNVGLPLEIAYRLGLPMDMWGIPVQLSYIIVSIVIYALIAWFTKDNPSPLAALGLCLSPLVAALSDFILVAIGIAYLATIVLRRIGAALNAEDSKEDEWTDEDDELLEDLIFKWRHTRKDPDDELDEKAAGSDENACPTANPFEAKEEPESVAAQSDSTNDGARDDARGDTHSDARSDSTRQDARDEPDTAAPQP